MKSILCVWCLFCLGNSMVSRELDSGRQGIIPSLSGYRNHGDFSLLETQYMVSIKKAHGCDTAKVKIWNKYCEEYNHKCGGGLVAPDMVISSCHCMMYETFEVKGVESPPFNPDFDKWTSTTEPVDEPLQTFYFEVEPPHPIYNLMSLWMGSVDIDDLPQRQFAKAFFPHSECTFREIFAISGQNRSLKNKLWYYRRPNFDVGLIRTWEPFTINKDVKVVPLILGDEFLNFHRRVMRKMSACLLIGFGKTEYGFGAWRLRYSFRHVQCTNVCQLYCRDIHKCEVCATSIARPDHGIPVNWPTYGDSGSPIVCDHDGKRVLFSVHSQVVDDKFEFEWNATVSISMSLVCIRHLLTSQNMQHLRELDNQKYPEKFFKLNQAVMGPFGKDAYTTNRR